MARHEFSRFLDAALRMLEVEVPLAYLRLGERLAGRPLALEVDGEYSRLAFSRGRHHIDADPEAAALLRTSHAAILALVDGRKALLAALHDESVWLQGPADEVIALDTALRTFVAGAVRAPGFPSLLADYRQRGAPDPRAEEEP